MVAYDLAKVNVRVRFSLPAPYFNTLLSNAGFRFHVRCARVRIDLQGKTRSNALILTGDIDNHLGVC